MSFELSQKSIQNGSKTFYLASLFLDQQTKRGAYLLYRWCRECDDAIDGASDQSGALLELERLQRETSMALTGQNLPLESPASALWELSHSFKVPEVHFSEILYGFEMDVRGFTPEKTEDLLKYCYHVAGVVGLMLCPILGVKDPAAKSYADALGRAMQLTNIARDFLEDQRMGRNYIPKSWLPSNEQLSFLSLNQSNATNIYRCVCRILELADEYYSEGRKGIVYLPFRAAWCISVASFLYQNIGRKISRNGSRALFGRTVLSKMERLTAVIQGTYFFILVRTFKKKRSPHRKEILRDSGN